MDTFGASSFNLGAKVGAKQRQYVDSIYCRAGSASTRQENTPPRAAQPDISLLKLRNIEHVEPLLFKRLLFLSLFKKTKPLP